MLGLPFTHRDQALQDAYPVFNHLGEPGRQRHAGFLGELPHTREGVLGDRDCDLLGCHNVTIRRYGERMHAHSPGRARPWSAAPRERTILSVRSRAWALRAPLTCVSVERSRRRMGGPRSTRVGMYSAFSTCQPPADLTKRKRAMTPSS